MNPQNWPFLTEVMANLEYLAKIAVLWPCPLISSKSVKLYQFFKIFRIRLMMLSMDAGMHAVQLTISCKSHSVFDKLSIDQKTY